MPHHLRLFYSIHKNPFIFSFDLPRFHEQRRLNSSYTFPKFSTQQNAITSIPSATPCQSLTSPSTESLPKTTRNQLRCTITVCSEIHNLHAAPWRPRAISPEERIARVAQKISRDLRHCGQRGCVWRAGSSPVHALYYRASDESRAHSTDDGSLGLLSRERLDGAIRGAAGLAARRGHIIRIEHTRASMAVYSNTRELRESQEFF